MENASKALLIAGGMLLLILVLSLAIYIFKQMGLQTSEFYQEIGDTENYEFNQQFFNYERNDLKIHDVVTVINLARDANKREKVPTIITVEFLGSQLDLATYSTKELLSNEILLNGDGSKKRYTCNVDYAENSNYVGKITITENEN